LRPATGRARDLPIEANGRLQRHERPRVALNRKERLVKTDRLLSANPDHHPNTSLPKIVDTCPVNTRIRVLDSDHHDADARPQDPLDTGSRSAGVTAWLQRAIQRGATSAVTSFGFSFIERDHLRVRPIR
jgi:hypothetical protein